MSKWEKLLRRIHTLSANLRFAELQKILESYGYVMKSPPAEAVIAHLEFPSRTFPTRGYQYEPILRLPAVTQ